MGKVEIGIYCYLTADIMTKVLQKCFLGSPLSNVWILSKCLNLIDCHGNWKAKFEKKYSKIICSEAIRVIKLKLCINVQNINFYKKHVFLLQLLMYFRCYGNFHWLIMEKVKTGIYCFLIVEILIDVFQKCLLSGPLPNIYFLLNLSIWLVVNAIKRLNFQKKKYKKIKLI